MRDFTWLLVIEKILYINLFKTWLGNYVNSFYFDPSDSTLINIRFKLALCLLLLRNKYKSTFFCPSTYSDTTFIL